MIRYKIAGLNVAIDNGLIKLNKELAEFETQEEISPDIFIKLEVSESVPEIKTEALVHNMVNLIYDVGSYYFITYYRPKFLTGLMLSKEKHTATIYVDMDKYADIDTENVVLSKNRDDISGPQELLYAIEVSFYFYAGLYGRIPVHSASIIYRDKAWLFAASSGTGKSTHVDMWRKMGYDFTDFNGDVAMIYDAGNAIMASSLPWCGTSQIYMNKTVELGGIFFLKRGTSDLTRCLNDVDGALGIISRSFLPNWDRELLSRTVMIATRLADRTKLYELYCTQTVEAAKVVKEEIDGGMEL